LGDQLEFFFDKEGGESEALMLNEFKSFARLAPSNLVRLLGEGPKFVSDEECHAVQAADMLAWLLRRYYFNQANGIDPDADVSAPFLANLFHPKHDWLDIWTEERIAGTAQFLVDAAAHRRAAIAEPTTG
jgi:hypothetical protein